MAASQVWAVSVTVGLNVAVAAAIEYQVVCALGVVTAVSAVQVPVDGLPKVFPDVVGDTEDHGDHSRWSS